jgi:hypothetical protein
MPRPSAISVYAQKRLPTAGELNADKGYGFIAPTTAVPTCSFTTAPSRPRVTAASRRTSESSSPPRAGLRDLRLSRFSRSSTLRLDSHTLRLDSEIAGRLLPARRAALPRAHPARQVRFETLSSAQPQSRYRPERRALQLDQLRTREHYAQPVRSEVDKDDGFVIDADDSTEAVLVVCHPIAHRESLNWVLDDGDVEGASRQIPPRRPGA